VCGSDGRVFINLNRRAFNTDRHGDARNSISLVQRSVMSHLWRPDTCGGSNDVSVPNRFAGRGGKLSQPASRRTKKPFKLFRSNENPPPPTVLALTRLCDAQTRSDSHSSGNHPLASAPVNHPPMGGGNRHRAPPHNNTNTNPTNQNTQKNETKKQQQKKKKKKTKKRKSKNRNKPQTNHTQPQ